MYPLVGRDLGAPEADGGLMDRNSVEAFDDGPLLLHRFGDEAAAEEVMHPWVSFDRLVRGGAVPPRAGRGVVGQDDTALLARVPFPRMSPSSSHSGARKAPMTTGRRIWPYFLRVDFGGASRNLSSIMARHVMMMYPTLEQNSLALMG